MPNYRLYVLTTDGHIRSVQVLECADDAAADRLVAKEQPGPARELWQGERLVRRYPAARAPGAQTLSKPPDLASPT